MTTRYLLLVVDNAPDGQTTAELVASLHIDPLAWLALELDERQLPGDAFGAIVTERK
jgi:hypothetical protein